MAFGFEESRVGPGTSVSKEEQERIFEEAWNLGSGFRFMFGAFSDIATDFEANAAAAVLFETKFARL